MLARYFSTKSFGVKNVACVVADEGSFLDVMNDLQSLGFEVACSSSLDVTFEVVAEDPEEWAMVIIRLDQTITQQHLETYIRLIRRLDVRIPVMVMSKDPESLDAHAHPESYADCVVAEPRSKEELSIALQIAQNASRFWGSRFDDVGRAAANRLFKQ